MSLNLKLHNQPALAFAQVRIFMDDVRPLPGELARRGGWIVMRDVQSVLTFIRTLGLGCIAEMSLDHDMGPRHAHGYLVCRELEDIAARGETLYLPNVTVHSANPVGAANMRSSLERAFRFVKRNGEEYVAAGGNPQDIDHTLVVLNTKSTEVIR